MTEKYKIVSLRQDYYNDITADELNSLCAESREMSKKAVTEALCKFAFEIPYICIVFPTVWYIITADDGLSVFIEACRKDPDVFLGTLAGPFIGIALIAATVAELIKKLAECKHFFFAKGKIISLASEYREGDARKNEKGYYKNDLTVAVSENEALGNVFYFSDEEWEEEQFIGRGATVVYYPKMHHMNVIIDGEDAAEYRKRFKGKIFLDEKKERRKNRKG